MSKSCQVADYENNRILCGNINITYTSEKKLRDENFKHFNCCYSQFITPVNSSKLAKLMGNYPFLNFNLKNKLGQGLYDTGSMIRLTNKEWVNQGLRETEILLYQ